MDHYVHNIPILHLFPASYFSVQHISCHPESNTTSIPISLRKLYPHINRVISDSKFMPLISGIKTHHSPICRKASEIPSGPICHTSYQPYIDPAKQCHDFLFAITSPLSQTDEPSQTGMWQISKHEIRRNSKMITILQQIVLRFGRFIRCFIICLYFVGLLPKAQSSIISWTIFRMRSNIAWIHATVLAVFK